MRFLVRKWDDGIFVIVLYERLPTICFSCGLVGHGTNGCSHRPGSNTEDQMMGDSSDDGQPPSCAKPSPNALGSRPVMTLVPDGLTSHKTPTILVI